MMLFKASADKIETSYDNVARQTAVTSIGLCREGHFDTFVIGRFSGTLRVIGGPPTRFGLGT